jgi:L-fuculose-phosphate aldolase
MSSMQEQIVYIGRRMFERRLTDMSGGNISAREGNTVYITPRFSGGKKHWQLESSDILSGSLDTDELFNHPLFSREGQTHLAIYRNFPDVTAVLHAHPFNVLPFCAASRPMQPVLEGNQKFGVIECVVPAPAHSSLLADHVVDGLRGKEDRMRKHAAAVIIPFHGIIVAAKDLLLGIDALERIDWNAWCLLAQKMMD